MLVTKAVGLCSRGWAMRASHKQAIRYGLEVILLVFLLWLLLGALAQTLPFASHLHAPSALTYVFAIP